MNPAPQPRMITVEDLPPLTPPQIDQLVEETMSRDLALTPVGRRPLRARRWVIGATAAAIAVGFVIASSTGAIPTPQAQAWTPVPDAPTADDIAAHTPQCLSAVTPPTGVVRELVVDESGGLLSLGGDVTLPPQPSEAATPTVVLAERRGESFAMVMSNAGMCLYLGGGGMAAGVNSWDAPPRPQGKNITILMSGFAGGTGTSPSTDMNDVTYSEAYTAVIAVAGPDVISADVTNNAGQVITATVSEGWILAWWPTTDNPELITVTTSTGLRYTQPATAP